MQEPKVTDSREELGAFLRSRRARLRPADVGLEPGARRRVPGLRREELALLAGVSADYYVRLEQGRDLRPSRELLDALARALRLDDDERRYVHQLARPGPRTRRVAPVERVTPGTARLLRTWDTPAFVLGRRMDVLAWNRAAALFVTDFDALPVTERNMVRHVLLDDASRLLYVDWADVARETVAFLRLSSARHPDDPALVELVGELSTRSRDFAQFWAARHVKERRRGTKRVRHPLLGRVDIEYETYLVPDEPDQALVVYFAEPGSPSADALGLLRTMG